MAVLGFALGGMNLANWALLTAIVQGGAASGSQQEATPVGLFLAGLKAAAAVGNLLLAAIVAAVPHRVSSVVNDSITALLIIVTVIPAVACMIVLGLLTASPLPSSGR